MRNHVSGATGPRPSATDFAFLPRFRVNSAWLGQSLAAPALLLLVAGVVFPMVVIAFASISAPEEWGGVRWGGFSADAYWRILFEQDFDGNWTLNTGLAAIAVRTFALSIAATIGCLALGFPAALYIAMQPARRRTWLLIFVTVPFWTSLIVRLYAWILLLRSGGVISTVLGGLFGAHVPTILYTDIATVIGLVYAFIPFMVLPIFTSLEHMNWNIVDAAFDLGATPWTVVTQILAPSARHGIVSGCMLVLVPSLGAFLIPDMLGGAKSMMLGNLINLQFGDAHNWPLGASLAMAMYALVLLCVLAKRLLMNARTGGRRAQCA